MMGLLGGKRSVGIGEGMSIWRGGMRGGRGERDSARAWWDGTVYARPVAVRIEREAGDEVRTTPTGNKGKIFLLNKKTKEQKIQVNTRFELELLPSMFSVRESRQGVWPEPCLFRQPSSVAEAHCYNMPLHVLVRPSQPPKQVRS